MARGGVFYQKKDYKRNSISVCVTMPLFMRLMVEQEGKSLSSVVQECLAERYHITPDNVDERLKELNIG